MKSVTVFLLLIFSTFSALAQTVYVQASKGSFNDLAIQKFTKRHPKLLLTPTFTGTLNNTFKLGVEHSTLVFTAVSNSSLKGQLVPQAVQALQDYKIDRVLGHVELSIKFCAYILKDESKTPKTVVSHPAALLQISHWVSQNHLQTQDELAGTAVAVKNLSLNEYYSNTLAVGSCQLKYTYKNLELFAENVGNHKKSYTQFLLMKVHKRAQPIAFNSASTELIAKLKGLTLKVE
ncbi:hypothetical protein JQC92_09225 [Shewanella sp. 202IG2-18]|uniref:prephenate dehydratase domain-containing protein n=1 Tax=Parashewanella hymeniacidonis TaxID=2807618 RepID=UPI0019611D2D|nr:prephenate dehydratase domain-containing protein [Parashewanella hymeniacidonis]MBM7072206.1 hypothetical protein [Parashewanella hymeniacidonis]